MLDRETVVEDAIREPDYFYASWYTHQAKRLETEQLPYPPDHLVTLARVVHGLAKRVLVRRHSSVPGISVVRHTATDRFSNYVEAVLEINDAIAAMARQSTLALRSRSTGVKLTSWAQPSPSAFSTWKRLGAEDASNNARTRVEYLLRAAEWSDEYPHFDFSVVVSIREVTKALSNESITEGREVANLLSSMLADAMKRIECNRSGGLVERVIAFTGDADDLPVIAPVVPEGFDWTAAGAIAAFDGKTRRIAWRRDVRHVVGLEVDDWPMAMTIGQIAELQTCPSIGARWSAYSEDHEGFARLLLDEWVAGRLLARGEVMPHSRLPRWWLAEKREWFQTATANGASAFPTFLLDDVADFMRDRKGSDFLSAWLVEARVSNPLLFARGGEERRVKKKKDIIAELEIPYPKLRNAWDKKRHEVRFSWIRDAQVEGRPAFYYVDMIQAGCEQVWPRHNADMPQGSSIDKYFPTRRKIR